MNIEQAGEILAILNAGQLEMTVEPESLPILVSEIALLHDYDVAVEAARRMIRGADRFSIKEFRAVYRSVNESVESERRRGRELEPGPASAIPAWVHVWDWCRRGRGHREARQFPQQVDRMGVALSDEPTLTPDEYAALEREWRDAGAPKLGRAADLVAAHTSRT